MTRLIRKIATCCMMVSLAFVGGTKVAYAAGQPIAGITVLLSDININPEITNNEIGDIIEPIIKYQDIAIANVSNYVNIRSDANSNSQIIGKLYKNGAAKVLATEGEWVRVKSGNVTGYIRSDYLSTGSEVYEQADSLKTKLATVKANVLNVRSKAGTNASVLTQVPKGDVLEILDEKHDWVRVSLGDKTGYVSASYVDIKTDFRQAISVEEEQLREKLEQERQKTQKNRAVSSLRQQIVNYALKFNGNPYVWGGTSLTRGADCSGFTQSVLRNFGIYIPRNSRAQANSGRRVSMDKIQAGDLIFYRKNGVVNHVAMYIGNGKVIGAASRKEGINIKNYNYRTPYKAVSYINN